MSLTILLQGPVYQWTDSFVRRYKELPYVSEVIFSTWEGEAHADLIGVNNQIQVIKNVRPINGGAGNRNNHIVSSLAGLKEVKTEYVIKVRSDLFLPELSRMLDFYQAKKKDENIFTLSVYPRFAFHPRDYVFLGETSHVKEVFDIPLDDIYKPYDEWNDIRTESYIGMWYYRKYDTRIQNMINNRFEYLTDMSPKRKEALVVYHELLRAEKGFVPFPKVEIELPKHYPQGYPFDYCQRLYGEIYHGDIFLIEQRRLPCLTKI